MALCTLFRPYVLCMYQIKTRHAFNIGRNLLGIMIHRKSCFERRSVSLVQVPILHTQCSDLSDFYIRLEQLYVCSPPLA